MSDMSTADIVHMATLPPQAARAFMRECNMRLEERERHAYITGRTAEAALLARAIDGDDELQQRIQYLESENKDLERRADDEFDRAERAEERAADLRGELDDAKQEAADLSRQIHEAGVDLL